MGFATLLFETHSPDPAKARWDNQGRIVDYSRSLGDKDLQSRSAQTGVEVSLKI